MVDRFEAWRQSNNTEVLAIGRSLLLAALVTGCSSVPDAVNPVEWYKGVTSVFASAERPEIAAPRHTDSNFPDINKPVAADAEAKAAAKGLVGDRNNSNYASPVRRDPTPTKPLAKRAPPPTEPQTATTPAPKGEPVAPAAPTSSLPARPGPVQMAQAAAPSPAAQGKGSYQPSLDRRMPTARDEGPAAPPSVAPGGPPARPDIPEAVAVPGATHRSSVADHYQRRLAESASAVVKPGMVEPASAYAQAPAFAQAVTGRNGPVMPAYDPAYPNVYGAGYADAAPQLVPPHAARGRITRGARGVVVPQAPAASFQVAAVDFSSGALTATDRQAINTTAQVFRQSGGTVRVLGTSGQGYAEAIRHANAVAKALAAQGIPARKIQVGADVTAGSAYDAGGAQVFIDY
jgi:hypothetical protein